MLDLLLILVTFVICSGIGAPIAELLPTRLRWRVLLAPTLGFCVLAIAAPVVYRLGGSMRMLLSASAALAVGLGTWRLSRARRQWGALPVRERRLALLVVATAMGATLVLLAPRVVGGDQFAVFQGNQWDTYGYLQPAMVYARKSYATVTSSTNETALRDPLMPIAAGQLNERPSVHMLYAMFSRIAPASSYRLYYGFLVGCFVQLVLVLMFVLRNILPNAPPAAWVACALAFPLGFWGQYVFDINAWSQIASTPVLAAFFALALLLAAAPLEWTTRGALRFGAVLATVAAGALYVYPEGFIFYSVAMLPIAGTVPVIRMWRARRFAPRAVLPLAGIAVAIASTALYPPVMHHLIKQVTWSSGARVEWWTFFQAFFFGRDGLVDAPLAQVDYAAGLFGLYFATPSADGAIAIVSRLAILVAIAGILVGLVLVMLRRVRSELADESRLMIVLWFLASGMLLAPAGYLYLTGNYWPAGKAVSYAAPVFMTLACVPIAFAFQLRPVRWIVFAFVAFQLASGLVRIGAAHDGIVYRAPYPAVDVPARKDDFLWDLRRLEPYVTSTTRVLIDTWDWWAEANLQVFLYARKARYTKQLPVNTYFGAGQELGKMPGLVADLTISVEKNHFVLRFADGRKPVTVRRK